MRNLLMYGEKTLKIRARKFDGRCARHKAYNPARRWARRHSAAPVARCTLLFEIWEASLRLNKLIRTLRPQLRRSQSVRVEKPSFIDPRQMSLIGDWFYDARARTTIHDFSNRLKRTRRENDIVVGGFDALQQARVDRDQRPQETACCADESAPAAAATRVVSARARRFKAHQLEKCRAAIAGAQVLYRDAEAAPDLRPADRCGLAPASSRISRRMLVS